MTYRTVYRKIFPSFLFYFIISMFINCFYQPEAHATLISKGSNFGPNTVTLDTATHFQWLDLSVTAGMSFNFVSTQLGRGGEFFGYEYASQSEIYEFFVNAGIPFPSSSGDFYPENLVPVQNLLDLIGTLRPDENFPQTQGVSGEPKPVLTSEGYVPGHKTASLTICLVPVDFVCNAGDAAAFVGFGTGSWDDRTGADLGTVVGHWLRRDPRSIDEPTSTAILGFGLVALAVVAGRRARTQQMHSIRHAHGVAPMTAVHMLSKVNLPQSIFDRWLNAWTCLVYENLKAVGSWTFICRHAASTV